VTAAATVFCSLVFFGLLDYDLSRKKNGKFSFLIDYMPTISGKLKLKGKKLEPSKWKLWYCFFFNLSYGMIFCFSLFSGISYMAPWWFFRKPKLETYSVTLLWTAVYFLT